MSAKHSWLLATVEVITVGLPFCVFKLLSGQMLLEGSSFAPAGYALLLLGLVDLALNTLNLVSLVIRRRRATSVCLAELVSRSLGRRSEIGLAIDVFLSFGLVAIVVGFGLIGQIPVSLLSLWNLAVVLNVLGAGVGRLIASLRPARDS